MQKACLKLVETVQSSSTLLAVFLATAVIDVSLSFAADVTTGTVPSRKPAWSEAMLQLRKEVVSSNFAFAEASKRLELAALECGSWHRLELGLFGREGNEAWPINEKPGHDYHSSVEKRFLQDGAIHLNEEYLSAIEADGAMKFARFRPIDIEDNHFWLSPHRHRNRIEYYYRTIEVASDRTVDAHLGFCEGCKVFLNGKEIYAEFMSEPRKCAANQSTARLHLARGLNHVLVKLTSFKLPASKHNTYFSLNPVPRINLKEEWIRLFAEYPLLCDWFMQDTDRLTEAPVGADLNGEYIPKNMAAYCRPDRGMEFETQLIKRVLGELRNKEVLQKELDALVWNHAPVTDRRWLDLYARACGERRVQRLKHTKREFPQILFIKRHMLRPSFYGYTEGLSCANFERNFVPGSSLCLLEWDGHKPKVTELLTDEDGTFRDIDVSWDGRRILFAWKKSLNEDDYHLYEMSWPDRTVRQLTYGLSVADFEGRYLPNEDIIFSSTRCISTTDCWTTEVSNLYTCDRDGKFLRRLGFDQVVTTYPSVLENGNIIYTRWDYNDRGQVYPQPLFQMNPDGTGQTEYYGNNSWFPTVINHARGIQGTGRVLAVLHGHHTWQAGELAIIDRNKGTQEASGVQLIARVRDTKAVKVDRYGQGGNLHRHPYPLSDNSFVVAMTPYMNAHQEGRQYSIRFHLYWMDIDGRREMLVHDPSVSSAHPIPLKARKRPTVHTSPVDHRIPYGTYYMRDIYDGPGLKGVERGSIEKLRVVALEYRALAIGSNHSAGRGGGAMSSTPVSTGNGCWDIKKILGEAKVYGDGSAMFKVPANTPVYFQAIDQNGSMVQTMRSWSTLMPNETYGCIGCHAHKHNTPPVSHMTMAMKAGAQERRPFYGPARGFSFLKEIQPTLNKHCIRCHDGRNRDKVSGRILVDLTDKQYEDKLSKRHWTFSYMNLTQSKIEQRIRGDADHKMLNWISAQSVPTMLPPYFRGSATSELMKQLREGHGNTNLSRQELDLFAAWIDLGVPFCGDDVESNAWTDAEFEHYLQMQRKRERLAREVRENTEALIRDNTGLSFTLPVSQPRYLEYIRSDLSQREPAHIDNGR